MASNENIETAKIYQFPVGGRAALTKRGGSTAQSIDMDVVASSRIAVGGSWYHAAAVEADKVNQR